MNNDGDLTPESVCRSWKKVSGILRNKNISEDMRELYYIRGIVRNRMYCNEPRCIYLLKEAFDLGIQIDDLQLLSKEEKNWTSWQFSMEKLIDERIGG